MPEGTPEEEIVAERHAGADHQGEDERPPPSAALQRGAGVRADSRFGWAFGGGRRCSTPFPRFTTRPPGGARRGAP